MTIEHIRPLKTHWEDDKIKNINILFIRIIRLFLKAISLNDIN
jgi:hypothetical protein